MDDEVALHVVLSALVAGALHDWVELFRVHDLIDFISTQLAGRSGHLDARLHVTRARYDAAHCNQRADLLGSHFAQLCDVLLARFANHHNDLVIAAKLGRELAPA